MCALAGFYFSRPQHRDFVCLSILIGRCSVQSSYHGSSRIWSRCTRVSITQSLVTSADRPLSNRAGIYFVSEGEAHPMRSLSPGGGLLVFSGPCSSPILARLPSACSSRVNASVVAVRRLTPGFSSCEYGGGAKGCGLWIIVPDPPPNCGAPSFRMFNAAGLFMFIRDDDVSPD